MNAIERNKYSPWLELAFKIARAFGVTIEDIFLVNEKLREWEDYYNYHRPNGALQGQNPFERLIEKTRADVSQGS
jgi:DNA-binding XRE family transcriptional regulator